MAISDVGADRLCMDIPELPDIPWTLAGLIDKVVEGRVRPDAKKPDAKGKMVFAFGGSSGAGEAKVKVNAGGEISLKGTWKAASAFDVLSEIPGLPDDIPTGWEWSSCKFSFKRVDAADPSVECPGGILQ